MSSFIRTYGGNTETMRNSGMKAVRNAINAGLTINQIRDQARREGITFGYRAQEYLDARPASSFVSRFGGNEDSMRNAGMQAVRAATAAGLSASEIERLAKNEGVTFGHRAQDFFRTKRQESNLVEQMALLQMSMDQQRRQYASDLQAMRNTLNAASNPRQAEPVLGIKAAGKMKGKGGMRGAFSRGGNRIKGLKLNNINI